MRSLTFRKAPGWATFRNALPRTRDALVDEPVWGARLAEAFADERVTKVIAHTLPERNASTRVLEKTGFSYDGEIAENGEVVWRYWIRGSPPT